MSLENYTYLVNTTIKYKLILKNFYNKQKKLSLVFNKTFW